LPSTAVVILNWNGREFLRKFLPSVIQHSKNVAEIIIADNASTDSSIEFLQDNYPDLRIIQNLTNGGFAKGYNDALRQVSADYYVLLNSDIEVTENWIQPVIDMMESDHQIAACQPKLRSWHNPEKFEYAGAAGGFIDHFGYPFCRGRLFQSIETDDGQYDDACEIFWATGACLFVKADVYHEMGGFDNDFFAHMEEIDFCWRLKNAGYKIKYCPDSTVFHVGGGTLPKKSSHKTYLNFRNNLSLLYKNLPNREVLPVFALRFPLDAVAAFKFLLDGGFGDFYAVLRAHIYFYKNFLKLRKKRKSALRNPVSCIYKGNLIVDYYFKHHKAFPYLEKDKFSCPG
jgi:GT2 family glycosyltransferase